MRSLLMQDVITIRGSGTTPVVQSEVDWLDLTAYGDAVFWIEILELTLPGSGFVSLSFETAPAKQESLFVAMETMALTAVSSKVQVRKVLMNAAGGVPLARFLRWKLAGSVAGTWDVTFRVYVSFGEGNRNAFSPLALPGLLLWLRADQGVVLSGANVTDWKDQSGNGNHVSQSVSGSRPVFAGNGVGGKPTIDFAGGKFLENTVTSLGLAGSAYSVLLVAKGGNGSFLTLRRSLTYSASMFFLSNTYVYSNSGGNNSIATPSTLPTTESSALGFKSCHRYTGSGNPSVWLNANALSISGLGQATETGTTGFQVGTNTQAVPEPWNGFISELIVVGNAIADADRLRVEAYQHDFYGI